MKKRPIFHNDTVIKEALLLFGKGWTTGRIAHKMNVSEATIYNWKNKFPKHASRKVTSKLSKNGTITTRTKPVTTKPVKNVSQEVTISLTGKLHSRLMDLANNEVRTVSDQVKYLVHKELERLERNSQNIPF